MVFFALIFLRFYEQIYDLKIVMISRSKSKFIYFIEYIHLQIIEHILLVAE